MKSLFKPVLSLYILVLLWLVLFKFSADIVTVIVDYQTRSLNIIPFADYSRVNLRELMYNFVVFIPFGLLASINFKQANWRQKLSIIFFFSLGVELVQFILSIGATDITDIITNTLGGCFGLALYGLGSKYADTEKQDRFIVVVTLLLLIVCILLRVLVFKVRYQ